MFAIVRLGNQQFKVKAGDFIRAPFQDHSVESKIKVPVVAFGGEKDFVFDQSQLKGSRVTAVVVRQSLARKVLVFKKKRRKGYRRTRGHRQKITELKILEICSPEGKVSKVELKKRVSKAASEKPTEAKMKKDSVLKKKASSKAAAVKGTVSKTKTTSHKKVKKQAVRAKKTSSSKKAVAVKSKQKTTKKKKT